ncbi:MAG: restriction endonuclease subunit S, partial [Slackia sp.]
MAAKPRFDGEWVRLGELIGKAKTRRCGTGEYPVLSMTMHDGIVEQRNRFKKAIASKDTSSYKVVNPGQLVVGFPIDEGVIYVQKYPFPGIMSPAYNIWDIDAGKVDPSYLELALHGPRSMTYYTDKMRGTTARRRSITAESLCALEIPLPSLSVQRQVVALFRRVEKAELDGALMMKKLDALVKSRFVEMLNGDEYPMKTIGELAVDIRYGTSRKASESGRYTYLRMNNMTDDGRLDFADVKAIDLDGSDLEKCLVVKGDLLFNRTNSREKVGKTAVFLEENPMVIAGYIIRVRLGPEMESEYLSQFMNLPGTKAMLRSMAKGAVHQANINSKELAGIKVPVPPVSLQQEFLSFARQIDKSRFV